MSKGLKAALALGAIILVTALGSYFRNDILNIFNKATENLQGFKSTNVGSILSQVAKEISAPTPLKIGGSSNNVVLTKEKIVAQTNIQRYNNGTLLPLITNSKLDQAALAKANDMFEKQYFEHVSPTGTGPGDLAKKYGYDYILEGENLILGNFKDEADVVQHWMDSPGHRANILNDRFVDIGVAVVKGTYNGQTVWIGVQEFGLPLSACQQPDSGLKTKIDSDKAQLDQMSAQIVSLKTEIDSTNKNSPKYSQLVDQYNQLVVQYNDLAQTTKSIILQYNDEVNAFNTCVSGS